MFDHFVCFYYGEEFSAPRPNTKLEDHPLSALRDCLFDISAATLHTEGGSSFCCGDRNLASDRDRWRAFVNAAMNLRDS
jgi:hypothetical protein